jgi:hypothetical protein
MSLIMNISDFFSQASTMWIKFWPLTVLSISLVFLPEIIKIIKLIFRSPHEAYMKRHPEKYYRMFQNEDIHIWGKW